MEEIKFTEKEKDYIESIMDTHFDTQKIDGFEIRIIWDITLLINSLKKVNNE